MKLHSGTIRTLKALSPLIGENPITFAVGEKIWVPTFNTFGAYASIDRSSQYTNVHQVVSGDSLSEIAEFYHVTISELRVVNSLQSDLILVGQTIQIPRPTIATSSVNSTPKISRLVHRVKAGESLSSIAKQYNVNVKKLLKWNQDDIQDGNVIIPNQKIVILIN